MARTTKIFGAKLARARDHVALTQVQLAHLVGVNDETISRIERQDVSGMLTKHLPKLAQALGMNVEQLRRQVCAPDDAVGSVNSKGLYLPRELVKEVERLASAAGVDPVQWLWQVVREAAARPSMATPTVSRNLRLAAKKPPKSPTYDEPTGPQ